MNLVSSRSFARRSFIWTAAAALSASLSGCTMGTIQLSGTQPVPEKVSVHLSGKVHGGEQPVTGSKVQLMVVGTSGYGSPATALISTTQGVGSLTLTSGGSGYSAAPAVTITDSSGGTGTGATATATDGVNNVNVFIGGTGYTAPTVSFSGGGGSGATATATVSGGSITEITVTSAGSGYTSIPTVTISDPTGSGAVAIAELLVNGLTLTDAGSGYTAPVVTFTGGGGSGAAATAQAVPTGGVVTDSNGGFAITGDYTCPSATSFVYITASGGNPGLTAGTNNTAIVLAAALGQCSSLSSSTYIWMNEVTTAATGYALAQYFNTSYAAGDDSFGYPGPSDTQALTGITNAMATFNNLVDYSTGAAKTTGTSSATVGNGSTPITITMTPEASKLNTVADILAACVSSNGDTGAGMPCGTLFNTESTYDGSAAPTDTLQAAVLLNLHPTMASADLSNLYALQTAQSPFAGSGTQPTDWTLGIMYQDTSATPQMIKPQNLAIDGNGNVWVLTNNGSSSPNASLVELSPTGAPLDDPQTLNLLISGVNTSFEFGPAYGTGSNPRNIAIDTNNNVWFTASSSITDGNNVKSGGTVFEYEGNGASTGYSSGSSPYGIAIDASNDVFFSLESSNNDASGDFDLYELPAGGDLTTSPSSPSVVEYPTDTAMKQPENIGFDAQGNLWLDSGSAQSTQEDVVAKLSGVPSDATISTDCSSYPCQLTSGDIGGFTAVTFAGSDKTEPWGMTAGTADMYFPGIATTYDAVEQVPYSGSPAQLGSPAGSTFNTSYFAATDGAGNIWVSNRGAVGSAGGSVTELSGTGTVLSPVSATPSSVQPGFVHSGIGSGEGIGIDPSGNVWIANNQGSGGNQAQAVFEIVGAAAPTITPVAATLTLPTTKVGTKP